MVVFGLLFGCWFVFFPTSPRRRILDGTGAPTASQKELKRGAKLVIESSIARPIDTKSPTCEPVHNLRETEASACSPQTPLDNFHQDIHIGVLQRFSALAVCVYCCELAAEVAMAGIRASEK
jgi:hypothetical protein